MKRKWASKMQQKRKWQADTYTFVRDLSVNDMLELLHKMGAPRQYGVVQLQVRGGPPPSTSKQKDRAENRHCTELSSNKCEQMGHREKKENHTAPTMCVLSDVSTSTSFPKPDSRSSDKNISHSTAGPSTSTTGAVFLAADRHFLHADVALHSRHRRALQLSIPPGQRTRAAAFPHVLQQGPSTLAGNRKKCREKPNASIATIGSTRAACRFMSPCDTKMSKSHCGLKYAPLHSQIPGLLSAKAWQLNTSPPAKSPVPTASKTRTPKRLTPRPLAPTTRHRGSTRRSIPTASMSSRRASGSCHRRSSSVATTNSAKRSRRFLMLARSRSLKSGLPLSRKYRPSPSAFKIKTTRTFPLCRSA
ncbi:hypothetical protein BC828DRAFT_124390 [Blastocladiella britannica]|nr:hypothetical protein BC828DRAFT_124390 [Blastocladiella britannica]